MINVQIPEVCFGASGHNPVTTDSEIKIGTKIDKWHKPCLLYVVHSSAWILKLVETKIKVKYIVPGFKRTPPNTCQQWSHFLPFLRHLL